MESGDKVPVRIEGFVEEMREAQRDCNLYSILMGLFGEIIYDGKRIVIWECLMTQSLNYSRDSLCLGSGLVHSLAVGYSLCLRLYRGFEIIVSCPFSISVSSHRLLD